ncbi:hypothetical protein [Saccharothrix sp. ALI-22-I]|uniref:hypothetical protein n=1 Tax=Saccharothrix sp. ALI-22-I TaxID=1933778 RepID=UPI001179D820|nr:hypothetical protein [Saccharothrix sp. ALI-22-I]
MQVVVRGLGAPPDTSTGPVIVVGGHSPVFTGCRVAARHESVVENEEDGTEIAVCDPVAWSQVWPRLRRFYS